MPIKLLTSGGGGVNLVPSSSIASDQTMYLPTSGTSGGTVLCTDSSGNLGIGTSSPSTKLHVNGGSQLITDTTSPFLSIRESATGNSNRAVMQATSTGMELVADYGTSAIPILFKTSNTERMRINSSGRLLVGTTSSTGSYLFQVYGDFSTSYGQTVSTSTNSGYMINFGTSAGQAGYISVSGTSTSYNTSSDYRLKEDVQPVATPIDRLNQLKPVNFAWKINGERCDGFLAHELQEVIPEAATGTKDETRTEEYEVTPAVKDEEGNVITEAVMGEREVPVYQGIDQSKIVPLLTAALQEAVAKIESQSQTIESLTQRIEALEAR